MTRIQPCYTHRLATNQRQLSLQHTRLPMYCNEMRCTWRRTALSQSVLRTQKTRDVCHNCLHKDSCRAPSHVCPIQYMPIYACVECACVFLVMPTHIARVCVSCSVSYSACCLLINVFCCCYFSALNALFFLFDLYFVYGIDWDIIICNQNTNDVSWHLWYDWFINHSTSENVPPSNYTKRLYKKNTFIFHY